MNNFDKIIDRKNTKCYKWDYNKEIFGKQDLLSMWVAYMDFQSPPEVLEALRKRVDHGIFGYTGIDNCTVSIYYNHKCYLCQAFSFIILINIFLYLGILNCTNLVYACTLSPKDVLFHIKLFVKSKFIMSDHIQRISRFI